MKPSALVPLPSSSRALDVSSSRRLVESFLKGRKPRTLEAYRQDLEDFRLFTGAATLDEASALLLSRTPGEANGLALDYKAHLMERKLAAATVNRRLAALRSLVKLGRTLGFVSWGLEVESEKTQAYRDTRGPGRAGFRLLLGKLDERLDAKARRDRAILRLLYDLALRRGEVVSLDVEDVDLEAERLAVMGKGRTEEELLTLPAETKEALRSWLEVRGTEPGPLFPNFDRARKGHRMTGVSAYRLVRELGLSVGLTVRPHGLRHAAITEALDKTDGNVRAVQRFSRHRDLRVLNRYDDNREDLAGDVARLVAAGV